MVERLGEQGVFGELALVDHAPRNLSAVAVTDCRLAVIDESQFLWLVHETPTFAHLRALTGEPPLSDGPIRPPGDEEWRVVVQSAGDATVVDTGRRRRSERPVTPPGKTR